jgi:hypothetical protein
MISSKYAHLLFGFVLSALMSLIVSGIATVRTAGLIDNLPSLWLGAWLMSWLVAFPVVLIVAPMARRVVQRLVKA